MVCGVYRDLTVSLVALLSCRAHIAAAVHPHGAVIALRSSEAGEGNVRPGHAGISKLPVFSSGRNFVERRAGRSESRAVPLDCRDRCEPCVDRPRYLCLHRILYGRTSIPPLLSPRPLFYRPSQALTVIEGLVQKSWRSGDSLPGRTQGDIGSTSGSGPPPAHRPSSCLPTFAPPSRPAKSNNPHAHNRGSVTSATTIDIVTSSHLSSFSSLSPPFCTSHPFISRLLHSSSAFHFRSSFSSSALLLLQPSRGHKASPVLFRRLELLRRSVTCRRQIQGNIFSIVLTSFKEIPNCAARRVSLSVKERSLGSHDHR